MTNARATVAMCMLGLWAFCVTLRGAETQRGAGQPVKDTASAAAFDAESEKRLVGEWVGAEDRTERATALDVSVFGPHAFDVRNVTLTIRSSGEGVLRVSHAVVGQTGRKYSPSVIEARLRIGAPQTETPNRIEPMVTVVSAERKYLDGSGDHWVLEGPRVTLTMIDPARDELNVRLDTSDGRDSFGTTLKRRRRVRQ